MKKWLKDKMVGMEDLLEPLKKIMSKHMKVTDPPGDIKYTGYDPAIFNFHSPDFVFTKENREYEAERGRNLFDIVLRTAFHLGYEQGKRDTRATKDQLDKTFAVLDRLEKELNTKTEER